MTKTTLVSLLGILAAGALQAQEVPPFSFNVGAGFVEPIGTFGRSTDVGWNVQGGAGYNFDRWISAMLDVNYNQLGINSNTLFGLGAPGGTVSIWSFTIDPVIHLTGKSKV